MKSPAELVTHPRGWRCTLKALATSGARCGAFALVGSAFLMAGCGSANVSHPVAGAAETETATQPVPASPKITTPVGRDRITHTTHKPVPAQGIGKGPSDESSATGSKPVDPCTLVSRSEAQAIVHAPVAQPVEAPQGPTCIYEPRGAKNFITLAVESTNFSKVAPQAQLTARVTLTVAGHTAYCGNAGAEMMIVPLTIGKFLAITAPCPVATSFAGAALKRLSL